MDDLITIKEFAKILKKSESTVRTWKRRGNIPANIFRTIGSTVFVLRSEFDKWILNAQ